MVMDTALTMEPPSPAFVKMVGMAPLVTGIRMFAAGEHTNVRAEPHVLLMLPEDIHVCVRLEEMDSFVRSF